MKHGHFLPSGSASCARGAAVADTADTAEAAAAFAAIVFLAAGLLGGCGGGDGETVARVPADYRTWPSPVAEPLTHPIPGHESLYRRIYINQTGTGVDPTEANGNIVYDYPAGTVIVKESYPNEDGTGDPQLTAMVKDPSHPSARHEWVWIMKPGPNAFERVIENQFCATCHENANRPHPYGDQNPRAEFRDFVFYPYVGR